MTLPQRVVFVVQGFRSRSSFPCKKSAAAQDNRIDDHPMLINEAELPRSSSTFVIMVKITTNEALPYTDEAC